MTAYVVQGANPPPCVCIRTKFRAGLFRLQDYYNTSNEVLSMQNHHFE